MSQITITYVQSKAESYIPHTEKLLEKFKAALARFPDIEEHCSIEYLEPEDGEDEPGIHVNWANENQLAFSNHQIYFASPLDLSKKETASIEELKCLHDLIGDFFFDVSGTSSHGDDFISQVNASNGEVEWQGDWH